MANEHGRDCYTMGFYDGDLDVLSTRINEAIGKEVVVGGVKGKLAEVVTVVTTSNHSVLVVFRVR